MIQASVSSSQPSNTKDRMNVTSVPSELTERFKIIEEIQEGIYRAEDPQSKSVGVLKLLRPAFVGSASERQRLKRELVKQTTLSSKNLALPTLTGEAVDTMWLYRPMVEGISLRDRLCNGTLAPSEAMMLASQVAQGLDELHRAGLLHRDLTPDNIIMTPDGQAVLINSGLAPRIEGTEVSGSARYVSPEQVSGKLVSFRSDLYGLGCVLVEAVTGEAPFIGVDADVLNAHVNGPTPVAPTVYPPNAQKIITQMLTKDPRERPFSAQQVRRAFTDFIPDEVAGSTSASPSTPPSSKRPPRPPSMNPSQPAPVAAASSTVTNGSSNGAMNGSHLMKEAAPAPDATQPLSALDIEEVDEILAKSKIPKSSMPPAPPSLSTPPVAAAPAATTVPPADAAATVPAVTPSMPPSASVPPVAAPPTSVAPPASIPPASVAPPASISPASIPPASPSVAPAAQAAAPMGDLDYDDLAETMAKERPAELAGMMPSVAPNVGASQNPVVVPGHPAPYPEQKKSSAWILFAAAALIFLAVLVVAGVYIWSQSKDGDPVAANTSTETTEATETATPVENVEAVAKPAAENAEAIAAEATETETEDKAEVVAAEEAAETETENPDKVSAAAETPKSDAKPRRGGAFKQAREEAKAAFKRRDYAAAERGYIKATKLNPRHAGSYAAVGAARRAQKNPRGAVQAYLKAVRLKPRDSGYFTSLGHSYRESGDKSKALQAYRRAVVLNPKNTSAQKYINSAR